MKPHADLREGPARTPRAGAGAVRGELNLETTEERRFRLPRADMPLLNILFFMLAKQNGVGRGSTMWVLNLVSVNSREVRTKFSMHQQEPRSSFESERERERESPKSQHHRTPLH
eukprot:SAG31_NODE_9871_length_1218_cov_1.398570_1_plen_114_part_01